LPGHEVGSGATTISARERRLPKDDGGALPMPKALRCLVIGLPQATFPEGAVRADEAAVIGYAELAEHLPALPGVELVVAPLFCADFDALEIIETLGRAGYRAGLRIVAPKLPNRQIVLRELRSHAVRQGITLEMIEAP
jgi:hypothetical protein